MVSPPRCRSLTMLPLLLTLLLTACRAAPTQPTETTTETTLIPPAPTGPTAPPDVVTVQEQVYIITGVFLAFTVFLLGVTIVSAYIIIGLRHKIRKLEAGSSPSEPPPRRRTTKTRRPTPGPPPAVENRAYAPDDDDDDVEDELHTYQQYSGRQRSNSVGDRPYDRFHKPMPDSYLPQESGRQRHDSNSRYGAGNLARLAKGPAPQPPYGHSGESRYGDDRSRRPPASHGQW